MEQDLMRIGVSLPEKLLNKFDEIILQEGVLVSFRRHT